jgi:hypothetical protein
LWSKKRENALINTTPRSFLKRPRSFLKLPWEASQELLNFLFCVFGSAHTRRIVCVYPSGPNPRGQQLLSWPRVPALQERRNAQPSLGTLRSPRRSLPASARTRWVAAVVAAFSRFGRIWSHRPTAYGTGAVVCNIRRIGLQ